MKEDLDPVKSDVIELWTGMEESEKSYFSNLIAPFMYHKGSDQYARIELASCFQLPTIDSSWYFNAYVDFENYNNKVLEIIAMVKSYDYAPGTSKQVQGALGATTMHLINAKKAMLRVINEIMRYINLGGVVDLQTFLANEWSQLLSAFSGLLIENKAWRSGRWDLKYWYPIATSKRRGTGVTIPKTITIEINADNIIRFNLERFEPVLETNTGLRIKAKYLNLISESLGIPWGFQGISEWLDLVDRLPIADWVDQGTEPGERILKWFSILTKSIDESRSKILIQNQTDVKRIAELISYKIIQAAALVAMENKVWEKGLKEAGIPWNREVVKIQMNYSLVAEPDGELVWKEWVDRTIKYLGYPMDEGEESFVCMLDIGHPIEEYAFYGIKDHEISENKPPLSLSSVSIAKYRFYDLKEGWYPKFSAKIFRDGTIVPSEWKQHGIILIEEIDDWMKVFYRTGAFTNPTLKISLVPVKDGWRQKMEEMGISDAYAGLGYKFKNKGRVLPVRMSDVENRAYESQSDQAVLSALKHPTILETKRRD